MKYLKSTRTKLFLTCWIVLTIHFATNTVRELYPAFSIIEQGTFKVDKYQDFHPDIFVHTDGHAYVGNNVASSLIAAIPLFVFDPLLDWLESTEKARLAEPDVANIEYRNERHPNSQLFYQLAKKSGLTLRFGCSAMLTAVFVMGPLAALMAVLMCQLLIWRGLSRRISIGLSLLFVLGTPVFFRSGVFNHNALLTYTTFGAFYLLWRRKDEELHATLGRRVAAGLLCGFGLAMDYSGVVPLLAVFGYLVGSRLSTASLGTSIRESIPFVLATVPPVLFLLYSQWTMFGDPFLPGQFWMPDVSTNSFGVFENPHSTEGFRGFTLPALDLYFLSLFDPSYGMYTFGPLLALGLIPAWKYGGELILPTRERRFVALFFFAFLTFCAANQYSRIQFNSGFRYLMPVVPFVYLAVCDHLIRLPRKWLAVLLVPVLLNSWVISMIREPVGECWQAVLADGPQLPWLSVLRMTLPEGHAVSSQLLPLAILGLAALVIFMLWRTEIAKIVLRTPSDVVARLGDR